MDSVEKYLPEPQSLKAVLKLDDDVCTAWLHTIYMEIKNLIKRCNFMAKLHTRMNSSFLLLNLKPNKLPPANSRNGKLAMSLVATSRNVASRKTKVGHQQQILQQRQDIDEASPSDKPNVQPVDIPQPFEDTWSPCASSRGVKLLLSTTCATRRTLKSADFIGAYLQAKVIGQHFVKLPLEYAYLFPSMLNSLACPTKESTASSNPANTGILNFRNGSTHKDSSNLLPNHPILSDTTNTINGSASYFLSTICSMSVAMTPSKSN
jgi:hypothetical protein